VVTVDKNAAYPKAFNKMKAAGVVPTPCELRQHKYRNNLVEQDHRFIKRPVKPGMGFWSFETARKTLQGYEVMQRSGKARCKRWTKERASVKQSSSRDYLKWQVV
jgi:transposase-like protein